MQHPKEIKALHKRLIFSFIVWLLFCWQTIDRVSWLHGFLLPDRRRIQAHWVDSDRQVLRPVQLLFPVTITQIILFVLGLQLQPAEAIVTISAGNLALAGIIMMPAIYKKKPPVFAEHG